MVCGIGYGMLISVSKRNQQDFDGIYMQYPVVQSLDDANENLNFGVYRPL